MSSAKARTFKLLQQLAPESSPPLAVLHRHTRRHLASAAAASVTATPATATTSAAPTATLDQPGPSTPTPHGVHPSPTSASSSGPPLVDLEDLSEVDPSAAPGTAGHCGPCPVRQQCLTTGVHVCATGGKGGKGGVPGEDIESPLAESLRFSTPGLPKRAKARLAGPSGNFWYAVEVDANVKNEEVVAAVFWKTSIAIWRDANGKLHAIEDRCAHRQLRLSAGFVEGETLACCYHGWAYDEHGKVVKIAHEIPDAFRKESMPVDPTPGETVDGAPCVSGPNLPKISVRTYPIAVKYGLIFVFPGDPALADSVPLPSIPHLVENPALAHQIVDLSVNAHWTLIVDNNCDFMHAFLHRKYRPFVWPHLKSTARIGDTVRVEYLTDMASSPGAKILGTNTGQDTIVLEYQYPYQRSDLANKYAHICFLLPIDEKRTRTFYIFTWKEMKAGPIDIPNWIRPPIVAGIHKLYLVPVLKQDLYALEEEQACNDLHATKNSVELNPLVSAFQSLTVEKWQEYLDSERARRQSMSRRNWRASFGAGLSDWRWADL
ncbi:Rieske domain-containing protein, variant [Thecamonas trahens ATCC 50062]|uniref:Rieske domain-containing protein, variant n=1 Tax=Thecamonas trahens ATCC 50062 TaxID=461836 RepID=A0A0L0DJ79_THETB|nr:Rieske domain-containing protein, variant [Thecamonas trahens ATCC 50062]KNC52362.1 Rieske domain-containing protein, variant [Thecamonas trahens ATCC 50062]|eukprot:XP_013755412.1 Rieske domain-containing protein, variant [Thecamonas trahens ATCC 50062]